jgi:outer membrane protein assembly factor BamB
MSKPSAWKLGYALLVFCAATANAAPSLTLSLKSGPPTSQVLVSGQGFEPNAGVDIYFDTREVALVVTNSRGGFANAKIHVPRSAQPGEHSVTALELNNDHGAQQPFLVHTDWAQFQFEPDHSSVNPFENVVSQNNVTRLTQKWAYTNGGRYDFSTPIIANGIAYLTANNGLYALNTENGSLLWSFQQTSDLSYWTPAVADGLLYVPAVDALYALDAATGATKWTYCCIADTASSPTVVNGVVYYGMFDTLYALSAKTGKLIWSYPMGSQCTSAPAVVNGVVFAGSFQGNLFAIDAVKGTLIWEAPISIALSSPAVADGAIFVGATNGTFYALNAATGSTLWSYPTTAQVVESSPSVSNGIVYFVSNESNLYALNEGTGSLVWEFPLGGMSENQISLAFGNDVLYLGYDALYAFDPPTGRLLWNSPKLGLASASVSDGVVYTTTYGGLAAFSLSASESAGPGK